MATLPKFADRVMDTSTTTSTGTYTLSGTAVTGYQSFNAGIGDGNTCYYCAMDVDGSGNPTANGWEVGRGTYTNSSTTLTRDKVLFSTNSNAAVSWSAGTRRVFVVWPATRCVPNFLAKTANYSIVAADLDGTGLFMTVDATSGAVTITLPAAANVSSQIPIEIKKIDSSANAVTIQRNGTPGTDLIDGQSSIAINAQYGARRLLTDNSANFYLY